MPSECLNEDWIIELNVRPNGMSPIDPPLNDHNENYSRLLLSVYAMTLGEHFLSRNIDSDVIEHMQMEKEYSKQDDLSLVWSDDVSLALCFLASLAHNGEYSQEHLLQQYFRWWMNGYMCPTGLCFTPRTYIKKIIDSFGESLATQGLGLEINMEKTPHKISLKPAALIQMSPISYFYSKHSYSKRVEIVNDCVQRMFGRETSTDVFVAYIELLANALNGLSKQESINLIKLKKNSNDYLNRIFFDLIDLILNDNNNIQQGVQLALEKQFIEQKECQYLNPLDSNENILLTLYLQISAAIYNSIPDQWLNNIYAKNTIESLIKWIIYRRNQNLHSF
ncbi:unnamed protein product [Rotaria magnacalcarata]|uniref:Uncharacterized protein n=1 Tax=Rotaria magnacalcarata TaxID=392030 RepID=A0A8S3CH13_9BILA|nr:unnamed protein product [Rotaria magnacalcarata]CAF5174231.1 unnamed protein product [Rotaria magnacalcarata]